LVTLRSQGSKAVFGSTRRKPTTVKGPTHSLVLVRGCPRRSQTGQNTPINGVRIPLGTPNLSVPCVKAPAAVDPTRGATGEAYQARKQPRAGDRPRHSGPPKYRPRNAARYHHRWKTTDRRSRETFGTAEEVRSRPRASPSAIRESISQAGRVSLRGTPDGAAVNVSGRGRVDPRPTNRALRRVPRATRCCGA
jgi:hypothetical protein